MTEPDGTPGEWYLHLFDPKQPDLNWDNPEVRAEFLDVLRFWFDRGADGFRIDVAHGLVKQAGLPDLGRDEEHVLAPPGRSDHPHWDRPEVHEIGARSGHTQRGRAGCCVPLPWTTSGPSLGFAARRSAEATHASATRPGAGRRSRPAGAPVGCGF